MGRSSVLKLLALVGAAFALRALGAYYGMPYPYHQDEPMMVTHALGMGAERSLHPHYFVIPSFVMTLLFFIYGVAYATGRLAGLFPTAFDYALTFYTDPTFFYVSGRVIIGAAFGAGTVWALWRLGRRYFSDSAAWCGAALLGLAFLHVQNSRHIYADVPMTFFLVLFFDAALRLIRKPGRAPAFAAGLYMGLAASAKYNAVIAIVPIVVGFFAIRGTATFARKAQLAGIAALTAAAVFLVVNPYILLDWQGFLSEWTAQGRAQRYTGWFYHLFYSLANGLGLPLLACSLIGLWSWVARRHLEGMLLAGFVIFYYVTCVYLGQPYARYMVPLVPFACLAAGDAIVLVASRLQRRAGLAAAALVLAAGAMPLAASVYEGVLMSRQDTRTLAARWIERHAPEGTRIALDHPFFAPRLGKDIKQIEANADDSSSPLQTDLRREASRRRKTYELYFLSPKLSEHPRFESARPALLADPKELLNARVKYVVFNLQDQSLPVRALREWAAEYGELAAVFSPYGDGRTQTRDPMALTAGPILLSELFSRRRMGPYLEIYELS